MIQYQAGQVKGCFPCICTVHVSEDRKSKHDLGVTFMYSWQCMASVRAPPTKALHRDSYEY